MITDFAIKVIEFLDDYGTYNDPEIGAVCIACGKSKKVIGLDYVAQHDDDCELIALLNDAMAEEE